jgi:DNA-binding transcriptional LysR family regulator
LRISAPVAFGRVHVAPVAAHLVTQYPSLNVDLRLDDRLVDLVEARIDVAVRIGAPRDSTAVMRKLADNRRILVAAPRYLDRSGRPRTPADAAGHAFLRYDDDAAPWRLEGPGGEAAEIDARCRLRADSGDVVHDWTVAGRGIAMRSEVDVAAELADGRLERVLPHWRSGPAPIYALFPSPRHLATKVRAFVEALAQRLAGL